MALLGAAALRPVSGPHREWDRRSEAARGLWTRV